MILRLRNQRASIPEFIQSEIAGTNPSKDETRCHIEIEYHFQL